MASGAFNLAAIATTVVGWEEAPEAWLLPSPKLVVRR